MSTATELTETPTVQGALQHLIGVYGAEPLRALLLDLLGDDLRRGVGYMLGALLANVEAEGVEGVIRAVGAGEVCEGTFQQAISSALLSLLGPDIVRPMLAELSAELGELGHEAFCERADEAQLTAANLAEDEPTYLVAHAKGGRRLLIAACSAEDAGRRYAKVTGARVGDPLDVSRIALGPCTSVAVREEAEDDEGPGAVLCEFDGEELHIDGSAQVHVLDLDDDDKAAPSQALVTFLEGGEVQRATFYLRNGCGEGVPLTALLSLALHQARGELGEAHPHLRRWIHKAKTVAERLEQGASA